MRTEDERNIGVTIGRKIKLRRKELGMTQKDLAKKIGRHFSIINKIETGETSVTLEYAVTFAKALDCSLDYLVGGEYRRDKSDDPFAPLPIMQRRVMHELNQLSWKDQREVLNFVRYMAYKRNSQKKDGELYADDETEE